MPQKTSGFSLLELTVAMLFMSLLLAGMVRVYLASLGGWHRVNASLTAQRALRWAMDRIAEDVGMMGYLFPPPELRSLAVAASADPALQSAFMLVPGRAGGPDELSFVMDVPDPARVALDCALAGPTVPVLRPARDLELEAGDLLLVPGERFEFAQVAAPVKLGAGRAGPVLVVRADGAPGAAFGFHHGAGIRVQVVRPLRLVRYAVVPMATASGRGPVPCLVRFETAYPKDRAVPGWARVLKASHAPGEGQEVVAEHVTRFRVDFTPDLTFPGIRGADYPATVRNLNARIKARWGRDGAATQPLDPFWFRKHGGLLKVELETGGPDRRAILRSQTLLLAPGNFGL